MPGNVFTAEFRSRQPTYPAELNGRHPEMDPNEAAVTCSFCGFWGIIEDDPKLTNAAHWSTEDLLACGVCEERDNVSESGGATNV